MTDRAPTGVRSWVMEYFKLNPRTRVTLDELVEASGFTETQIRNCISGIKYQLGDRFPLETFTAPRPDGAAGAPLHVAWSYRPEDAYNPGPQPDEGESGNHRSEDSTGDDGSGIRLIDTPEYESAERESEIPRSVTETLEHADDLARRTEILKQTEIGRRAEAAADEDGEARFVAAAKDEVRPFRFVAHRRHMYEELAITRRGEILVEDEDGEVYRLVHVQVKM